MAKGTVRLSGRFVGTIGRPEIGRRAFLAGACACLASAAAPASAELTNESTASRLVIAPAAPGSGWDLVARALADAAAEAGGPAIEVVNVPGAGGTVGLDRFLGETDRSDLLLTGSTMLTALAAQHRPGVLGALTPVARLTVEYFALVVPPASALASVEDLRAAMQAEPEKTSVAGGPIGSVDQLSAITLTRALGVDAHALNYVPFIASADAAAALAEGRVALGIATLADAAEAVEAGRLKVLAVTAPERIATLPAPTLAESGLLVEISNWRGILAKAALPAGGRDRLAAAIERLTRSPAWSGAVAKRGWTAAYLGPDAFAALLRDEHLRIKANLAAAALPRP